MKKYAQLTGNIVTAIVETDGEMVLTATVLDADGHDPKLGQAWDGMQFADVLETQSEAAKKNLLSIDRETGMQRTMREALIAIADKVGANVAYLKTKEAEAATHRTKL